MTELRMDAPNEKQRRFLLDRHRHIAYGGARGGGKSWAVRTKAKLLALRYAGIKLLIVRRTLRELQNNHIDPLRQELAGVAKYKAADKRFEFPNGSVLTFGYCACDGDLGQYQGAEYAFFGDVSSLVPLDCRAISSLTFMLVNQFIFHSCWSSSLTHQFHLL